jgi:hypothetical protein
MADFLHDDVFDSGLSVLTTLTENLYICSSLPTTFTEASSTYKLGTKATPTVGSPADRSGGGREVTISAITDGTVGANGTAGFYALTDDSASKLLAQGDLNSTQVVTSGNTFTLTSFKIGIPDPA